MLRTLDIEEKLSPRVGVSKVVNLVSNSNNLIPSPNNTQRKVVEGIAGDYEIPQRNGVDWKKDFKFVTKLDSMLADGFDDKLKKKEMEMCNQLYKYYGNVYDPV